VAALEAATRQRLGSAAQLSVAGERAAHAQAGAGAGPGRLAGRRRASARAVPLAARLTRSGDRLAPGAPVHWSGTLPLSLPA
jgi:general secretion pathway protein M